MNLLKFFGLGSHEKTQSVARPAKRKLAVEGLEDRQLMAGDLSVSVNFEGDLVVTGDSAGNGLYITQVAPNTFDVGGQYTSGAATRVNGSYGAVRFYNVVDDLDIKLNGGADRVTIGGYDEASRDILPDDLRINSGDGNDFVRIQWLSNRDSNDVMSIQTGWGDDRVEMYKVVSRDTMTIDTAQNWDTVDLNYITAGTALNFYGGAGNDTFKLNQAIVDRLYADMGSENDYFSVRNSNLVSIATVNGNYGSDTLNQTNNNRWISYSNMEYYSYNNF